MNITKYLQVKILKIWKEGSINISPSFLTKKILGEGEIKTIINKDEEFFKMLYCCGVITEYGLQLMKVSSYRLKLYRDNNMIDIVYENRKKGYRLTTKAKKIMSKMYGLKRSYTYRSINHCSKLQEIYLNLDLERYEWITESEAIDLLRNKASLYTSYYKDKVNFRDISPVDAVIVDHETNVLYGIEVVSKSYREKDLEKRRNF